MEGESPHHHPRSVEEVFKDFEGRREGILKALTSDVEDFFRQCDPSTENLSLYGFPDGRWEVNAPADFEGAPSQLPEPVLGINFCRDGLVLKDWLAFLAIHSDVWLLSVAYFYCALFDQNERKRLFDMIHDLPTVLDVVEAKKKLDADVGKKAVNANIRRGKKSKSGRLQEQLQGKPSKRPPRPAMKKGERSEEDGKTFCAVCGVIYKADQFWIGCDECDKWFHGKCVNIRPVRAEDIKHYKCLSCCTKKAGNS